MISELLVLLKDAVNSHLSASSGWGSTQSDHGQVVFPDSDKVDAQDFKLGAITLLLVNLEQEHSVRAGDPYRSKLADGTTQLVFPPIHLSVYVLFAARFKDYQQSLKYISIILQFFQKNRILDHENSPALSDRIEKVILDLVTLPLAEQHNLWGLMRSSYQPSLLYKVRMVVFRDDEGLVAAPPSTTITRINP